MLIQYNKSVITHTSINSVIFRSRKLLTLLLLQAYTQSVVVAADNIVNHCQEIPQSLRRHLRRYIKLCASVTTVHTRRLSRCLIYVDRCAQAL